MLFRSAGRRFESMPAAI